VLQIIEALTGEYDVDETQLERDVREFVDSLDQRDMLLQDEVR
jgi:hypothetical protein